MNAPSTKVDEQEDELVQLVADIRARGVGQVLPVPSPDAVGALVARLRGETPMKAEELAEFELEWRATEDERRAAPAGTPKLECGRR